MTPLSEKLGYQFQDEALLKRALTHAGADSARSNERLEFLGDRVLGLVIAEELFRRHPNHQEGLLAPRLSQLVRREVCGMANGRGGYLVLGAAEQAGGWELSGIKVPGVREHHDWVASLLQQLEPAPV